MQDRTKQNDEGRKQTALFAQLVEILTQNAVMLLGAMPDRQGRQRPPDLNGAEMFIEMLNVLQKKTKGNLSREEDKMISSTLYQLQTAFAEVASKTGEFGKARKATEAAETSEEDDLADEPAPAPPPSRHSPAGSQPQSPKPQGIQAATTTTESKVKFTKKYD
ncbi:MAG: DUF1844 domain-containing protein [Verrucomicrobia bacterium]|nr:DUF1844 domain-containing protein [Verrucomicrobiota bacterium]